MSLTEALVEEANIELAWKNVKANRGAPGPDGITITEFPTWFRPRWNAIRQQLLDGTYQPQPVRRVTIDKPDGGKRLLGIPNLIDRLIQQAIVQILTPVFDPGFSDSSYGFRPKRSAHGAAKQVRRIIRRGYHNRIFNSTQVRIIPRQSAAADFPWHRHRDCFQTIGAPGN